MKKLNVNCFLFILFNSLFILSSCSSSDDGENSTVIDESKLLGKWELYRYLDSTNEEGYGLHDHACASNKDYWEFLATSSRYFHKSWDPECNPFSADGNWSISNGQLTIAAQDEFESFTITYEIVELTDTKLIVKENEGNGVYWIEELRKVN